MQETLLHSPTPTPTSPTFPPPLSRPKHLHFPIPIPNPPLPKHTLIHQSQIPIPIPNTPSSLEEKLLYLDSLGIDSFHCLSTHPQIIQTPLPQIKQTLQFLNTIPLSKHALSRSVSMCPDILTSSLSETLIPAITFLLREAHVSPHSLRHLIHRRPRLLTSSVAATLRPSLHFLQHKVGVDDVTKCATLLSCDVTAKFLPRIEYVQSLGFSKDETFHIFRKFPALFCYSIEGNFEPKVEYLVVEMGREVGELLGFPQYFSFSLENRIKVRHRMCVERGVCLSLPVMLKSCDRKFREGLEVCCSSSSPVRTSPLWCTPSSGDVGVDVDVT